MMYALPRYLYDHRRFPDGRNGLGMTNRLKPRHPCLRMGMTNLRKVGPCPRDVHRHPQRPKGASGISLEGKMILAFLYTFSLSSARATPTEHPKFHVEADKLHAYIAEKIETFQLNQNRFRLTLADSHLVTDFAFDVPVTGILCPDLEVLTQPKEDMRPWLQKFAQNRPLLCEIQLGSHASKSLSIQTKITVESLVLTTVQAISKGTLLTQKLLQQSWKPFAYNDADWVHDMEDIPPQAVTKSELPEGASVKKSGLLRPYSIVRGQTTTLQITSGGLTVRSKVKALENGYLGEYATFTRSDTKKRLSAKIVSSDLVKME